MSRKAKERQRGRIILNQSQRPEPNRRAWPIVRAYVPVKDAWRVSGCGTAGIVRKQPDGALTYSIFNIELTKGGLTGALGAENKSLQEIDEALSGMAELVPAFEDGDADLMARYVWGAYAMSIDEGAQWPSELKTRHLGLLPPMAGTKNWWLEQFVHQMMPWKLHEFAMEVLDAAETPSDKEIAVAVWMEFDLEDTDQLLETCRSNPDDFRKTEGLDGVANFAWIMERRYPPYNRVPHFLIGIVPGKVLGHAPSLSMASRLVMALRKVTGGKIALQRVDWGDASELRIAPPGLAMIK